MKKFTQLRERKTVHGYQLFLTVSANHAYVTIECGGGYQIESYQFDKKGGLMLAAAINKFNSLTTKGDSK